MLSLVTHGNVPTAVLIAVKQSAVAHGPLVPECIALRNLHFTFHKNRVSASGEYFFTRSSF